MATQLSAISFVSAPAFVGLRAGGGMQWLTYEFAVPLAMIFLMVILIPVLYKSGVVSIYEYLENRFNSTTRLLLSVVFQISRAFGTGVMVYTIAIILQSVLEIEFWQTIIIIGVITLIYSYQGGMKAVVWGDTIQMLILFAGILICFGYGLHYIGGWSEMHQYLEPDRLQAVDFSKFGFANGDGSDEFGFWPMVIGGFFLYASYYGCDQTQTQRTLSARNLKIVRQTLMVNGLFRFPVVFAYCGMGLIVGSYVVSNPEFMTSLQELSARYFGAELAPGEIKTDLMIPVFIRDYLPHGVIGILIVAILSAAMSSLSSTINSLSAVSMEDFVARGRKLEMSKYMQYSKLLAIFWGLVTITLAFFAGDIAKTVIEAINKVGSAFYGPILATFMMAIMVKRTRALGMNVGILLGVAVNFMLWLFVKEVFWMWWNFIGFAVTFVSAYLISLLQDPPQQLPQLKGTYQLKDLRSRESLILLGFFVLMVLVSLAVPYIF
jgi:SSS family transporter